MPAGPVSHPPLAEAYEEAQPDVTVADKRPDEITILAVPPGPDGERFRAEVQSSGHLVGDGFTIADLTLAALLAPVVTPEQFPYPQPARGHPVLARARDVLAEAGLVTWTRDMYARYRGRSAEIAR